MKEVADWIGLATLIFAITGAVAAAFWQRRKAPDHEAEEPFKPKPIVVSLHENDRDLVHSVKDHIGDLTKAVDELGDIVGKHRHAIGDQTAEIRRGGKQKE